MKHLLRFFLKKKYVIQKPMSFFFNGKIYYIYKGIKSQVLHQKEKIKNTKNP